MQLLKFKGLRPLTVATGLLLAHPNIAYADVDQFTHVTSVISNRETSNYLIEVDSPENIFLAAKRKFDGHFNNWQDETLFLSSAEDIVGHEDFKAIVNMGIKAVPFILNEIECKPSTLVWALNLIYGQKITNQPNTTISEACRLWIKKLKK